MSEINVLNASCVCSDSGSCDCNIEELHLSCVRNRTEVYATLPETGVVGVTYFIGDNSAGYTEYVWNGSEFVSMGTASGSFYRAMSLDELGLGKLSTATTLTNGAVVGMNSANQLMIPVATLNSYGAVKLGSQYVSQYPRPYHVGVTVNTDGKLVFNLRQTQSDGSSGCLKYQQKTTSSPFEMFIEEAGVDQMGIVKMLHSLNGYTEEEIESMRETHAASVGLVVEGLDSFCEKFFTDNRMQGYFDMWATGKDLAQQIWDDSTKRSALELGVTNLVLASAEFSSAVDAKTVEWLTANATDEYFEKLFGDRVLAKTNELVDAHWTDDLDRAIEDGVSLEVETQLAPSIKAFMSKSENVRSVAKVVAQTVQVEVNENSSQLTEDYLSSVVNSEIQITAEGEQTTFEAYVSSKIDAIVSQHLNEITEKTNAAYNRVNAINPRAYVLAWDGEAFSIGTKNPMTEDQNNRTGIPMNTSYTKTVILDPGVYHVRLSSAPTAPTTIYRLHMYRAEMTNADGGSVAKSTYQWHGDTGKGNDETTQGYYTGVGTITVPDTGRYTFTISVNSVSGWNYAPCAYVMVEFI